MHTHQITFFINDKKYSHPFKIGRALADIIRQKANLKGTNIACREGDCGACVILLGSYNDEKKSIIYKNVTSCISPVINAQSTHVVTIEGLKINSEHPIALAFEKFGASQCGYCTPGIIMSLLSGLLNTHPLCSTEKVLSYMDGNICRCTGYKSIERAVDYLCKEVASQNQKRLSPLEALCSLGILPKNFQKISMEIANHLNHGQYAHAAHKSQAKIIGGGTDLLVQSPLKIRQSGCSSVGPFISMKPKVTKIGDELIVQANMSIEAFRCDPLVNKAYPKLKEQLLLFASMPIRNMGTLAGNIVNASPIGDLSSILLSLNAKLVIQREQKNIVIPIEKFFLAYKKTALKNQDIVLNIKIPADKNHLLHFEKISKREILDIASVNSSISIMTRQDKIEHVRISAGGVSPIPLLLAKTSDFLQGKAISKDTLSKALEITRSEISPISDIRGSQIYKSFALGQLILGHFFQLYPQYFSIKDLMQILKQRIQRN